MTLQQTAITKLKAAKAAIEEAQNAVGLVMKMRPPTSKFSTRIRQDFSDAKISIDLIHNTVVAKYGGEESE